MKKRFTFGLSVTLAIVLGAAPQIPLAATIRSSVPSNSRMATLRSNDVKLEASKSARLPFSSKLLSKKPTQTANSVGSLPGQTITLLPDGRVLKIGGLDHDGPTSIASIGELSARLRLPRAWHSATMLPDGNVLIVGGIGANGEVVDQAEIFKPDTSTSEFLASTQLQSGTSLSPRVYHTATLLTEGQSADCRRTLERRLSTKRSRTVGLSNQGSCLPSLQYAIHCREPVSRCLC